MRCFASLRRQADFARLRQRGRRISSPILTFYIVDAGPRDPRSLVGITISKAIGKAVVRNKLRRRLAAILQEALGDRRPLRLLIVAHPSAADAPFAALRSGVTSALARA